MGCVSTQVHVVTPEQIKPPHTGNELNSEIVLLQSKQPASIESVLNIVTLSPPKKLKPKPLPPPYCFLFGETPTERKIVCFDSNQHQFSTISSRVKIPQPPIKYQPIEVIYEQSQELFSSHLFTKNSHPPYNFMLALWLDRNRIFLCGGVSHDFDFVSSESFIFDTGVQKMGSHKLGNNLMGSRFDKLPFMSSKRYSHMGVVYSVGLLTYIYVFGGRGSNDELMPECEKYSIVEKKWSKIQPMKIARSTGFSFVYRERIYVCGGYSGKPKRTKKIEIYHPEKDYWQVLSIKMHRGLETGNLFSTTPNELLFIGGNIEFGSVNSVVRVNLEEETYISQKDLKHPRVLGKGCRTEKNIIVFGGNFQEGLEIYDLDAKQWKEQSSSYAAYLQPEQINSFSYSQVTVDVEYEETTQPQKSPSESMQQHSFIFSHDSHPFILSFNMSALSITKRPVPMTLRLRSHMSAALLSPFKYFVCGGVSEYYEKPTRSSYIYYSHTNHCIEQPRMISPRYKASICVYNEEVFVFGGRQNEEDDCLCLAEKYSTKEKKWTDIRGLNVARHSALVFVLKGNILIVGGNNGVVDVSEVEVYNPVLDSMVQLERGLIVSQHVVGVDCGGEMFLFGDKMVRRLRVKSGIVERKQPKDEDYLEQQRKEDQKEENESKVDVLKEDQKKGQQEQSRTENQYKSNVDLSPNQQEGPEEELVTPILQEPLLDGPIEVANKALAKTPNNNELEEYRLQSPNPKQSQLQPQLQFQLQPQLQTSDLAAHNPKQSCSEVLSVSLQDISQLPYDIREAVHSAEGVFLLAPTRVYLWTQQQIRERQLEGSQLLQEVEWDRVSSC